MSTVIRGRLFVCECWNRRNWRPCSSVKSFDPLQKGWRSLRPMSVSRWRAASAVLGDHLYVCGGRDVSFRPHNCVESFETLSEVWEAQLAMVQGRCPRTDVVGDEGGDGTKTSYAERFDGAWTTLPLMSHRRSQCSTAVTANKLYACGGEDGNIPDTVERFDPAHETWELLRPTLHRRVDATVAVQRDRLYRVGGIGDDGVALDAVESYDPDTDSWEEAAPVLHAVAP